MSDPSYPVFPVFSSFAFVLVLIPLPWHLEAWNSGTCLYMIWTAVACLNLFVNSIVWHGNALNLAPVWCDISSRIIIGQAVGIPASALCISRRLYNISSLKSVRVSRAEKTRYIIIDLVIGLFFPLICIALEYIVQGHRFNIVEDIGCFPATFNVLPAYFLVSMWPILIGLASATYCTLAIVQFAKKQVQLNELLSAHKSMTVSRYFRLMALALTESLCTTPLAIFSLYLNATSSPVEPWRGWADTHFNFSKVIQVPSTLWHLDHMTVVSFELTRWLPVACAFIFFGFFGFAEEARRHYKLAMSTVVMQTCLARLNLSLPRIHKSIFRRSQGTHSKLASSSGSLPFFVTQPKPLERSDTMSTVCVEKTCFINPKESKMRDVAIQTPSSIEEDEFTTRQSIHSLSPYLIRWSAHSTSTLQTSTT